MADHLSRYQRGTYEVLVRLSEEGRASGRGPWVHVDRVGSRRTCFALHNKGWADHEVLYSRGGRHHYFRPFVEGVG